MNGRQARSSDALEPILRGRLAKLSVHYVSVGRAPRADAHADADFYVSPSDRMEKAKHLYAQVCRLPLSLSLSAAPAA